MVLPQADVTQALLAARAGEDGAADRLWSLVYDELHRLAHRELFRGRRTPTLSTTDLVHETYLKCVDPRRLAGQDRAHFFAIACRAMRQILVDHARRKNARKREGHRRLVPLEEAVVMAERRSDDLLALDEALLRLAEYDARLVQVVEYRFFGGFSGEEAAEILGVSQRTIERDWRRAKSYLYEMLRPQESEAEDE